MKQSCGFARGLRILALAYPREICIINSLSQLPSVNQRFHRTTTRIIPPLQFITLPCHPNVENTKSLFVLGARYIHLPADSTAQTPQIRSVASMTDPTKHPTPELAHIQLSCSENHEAASPATETTFLLRPARPSHLISSISTRLLTKAPVWWTTRIAAQSLWRTGTCGIKQSKLCTVV